MKEARHSTVLIVSLHPSDILEKSKLQWQQICGCQEPVEGKSCFQRDIEDDTVWQKFLIACGEVFPAEDICHIHPTAHFQRVNCVYKSEFSKKWAYKEVD